MKSDARRSRSASRFVEPGSAKLSGRIAASFAVLVLLMAGCSINVYEAGSGEGGGGGGGDGEGAVAQEEDTGEIEIAGPQTGVEAEAIQAVIDQGVNEEADFTATFTGSDSFEQNVVIQIEGGTPPDIAVYPQPGALIEQAEQGNLVSLEDLGLDVDAIEERYGSYLLGLGEYEGQHYGFPNTVNFKSAVWYNVPAFEEGGYEPPETWEDLLALSDQMVQDGNTPWCIGTGSEAATGWPATDWMEDIVLRQAGPETYDGWVDGSVDFASEEITAAAESFGEILFTDGYVFGGPENISSTDFRDAPDPMFNDDPACLMHRQATFITNFFPEGVTQGEDYDFFPFPSIDGNQGALVGGELMAVFSNRAEITEFLDLYGSAEAQCLLGSVVEGVALISPNTEVEVDCYENELIGKAAGTVTEAIRGESARFDASDLMPPAVGSGEFWNGMNNYTNNGPDNLESVLSSIDAAFPSSDGASE